MLFDALPKFSYSDPGTHVQVAVSVKGLASHALWQEKCPLLLGAQSSAKVCPTSTTLHPDTAHNLQPLESRVLNSASLAQVGNFIVYPWIKPRLDFTRDHTPAQPFSLPILASLLNLTDFSENPVSVNQVP